MNTCIYVKRRLHNWVVISNPNTGLQPKMGDMKIWIYDANGTGNDFTKLNSNALYGFSGDDNSESIKFTATMENGIERVWVLNLTSPLARDHSVSIINNQIIGETLWKSKGSYLGMAGVGQWTQEIIISTFGYDVVAHEIGHCAFAVRHFSNPIYGDRNLMEGTHPSYHLYKRELKTTTYLGNSAICSQWDYINEYIYPTE